MIILVGKSASGKTVIGKYLINKYGFKKFVTTTTRSPRIGETNDVDYHFVTKEKFLKDIKENKFVESTIYNDNYYGSYRNEIDDNKILIVEPNGLESYLKLKNENIVSFYIDCSKEIRKKRMIERKDKLEDINERLKKDDDIFKDELKEMVDFTIDSNINSIEQISEQIYKLYQTKK